MYLFYIKTCVFYTEHIGHVMCKIFRMYCTTLSKDLLILTRTVFENAHKYTLINEHFLQRSRQKIILSEMNLFYTQFPFHFKQVSNIIVIYS